MRELPVAPDITRERKAVLEWLRLHVPGLGTSLLELSENVPAREVFSSPAPIPEDIRKAMDVLCFEVGEEPLSSFAWTGTSTQR